eukprot:scaffold88728_cov33-Tisochrysis_lutea.AAC.1
MPFPYATQQQARKRQRVDGAFAAWVQPDEGGEVEVIGADDGDLEVQPSQATEKKKRGRPAGSKNKVQQSGQQGASQGTAQRGQKGGAAARAPPGNAAELARQREEAKRVQEACYLKLVGIWNACARKKESQGLERSNVNWDYIARQMAQQEDDNEDPQVVMEAKGRDFKYWKTRFQNIRAAYLTIYKYEKKGTEKWSAFLKLSSIRGLVSHKPSSEKVKHMKCIMLVCTGGGPRSYELEDSDRRQILQTKPLISEVVHDALHAVLKDDAATCPPVEISAGAGNEVSVCLFFVVEETHSSLEPMCVSGRGHLTSWETMGDVSGGGPVNQKFPATQSARTKKQATQELLQLAMKGPPPPPSKEKDVQHARSMRLQFKALDREHKGALAMCGQAKAALHDFHKYEMDMELKIFSSADPEAVGQRIRPMLAQRKDDLCKEVRGMCSCIQMVEKLEKKKEDILQRMAAHTGMSEDRAPKSPSPVIHSDDLPASAPCGRSTSLAAESIPSSSTPAPVGGAGDGGAACGGADAAPAAPSTSTRAEAGTSDTGVLPAAHIAPPPEGAALEQLPALMNTQEASDVMQPLVMVAMGIDLQPGSLIARPAQLFQPLKKYP